MRSLRLLLALAALTAALGCGAHTGMAPVESKLRPWQPDPIVGDADEDSGDDGTDGTDGGE